MSQRSSQPRVWLRGAGLVVALGVIAALAVANLGRETLRNRQIDREISALKSESASLQARNFELLSAAAALDSPAYLEREARLKLNLQKDGERVVVLHQADSTTGSLVQAPPAAWSNHLKWWTYFTDRQAYDAHAQVTAP